MQLTPAALNFLFTQFKLDFDIGLAKRSVLWNRIAERIPSTTESNTYGWLSEIPGFREWIGPRVFHNLAARSYSVTNKDWEDGFVVARNKIEDDQYGIYSRQSQLLGDAAAALWDNLVFDQLQAGTTTLGFDGQYFFDTDHPVNLDDDSAGTYANSFTAKPLTAANISFLSIAMMGIKGESGRSLEMRPDLLIVPPSLSLDAATALAPVVASGGAGIPNPLLSSIAGVGGGAGLDVLVVPRLENQPTVYYLVSTTRLKPIILQVRKEPTIVQRTDAAMDNLFYRKEYEYGADARGAAGYGLPFTIIRASTT
jgi:phage major head subunit gpT-like protein